MSEGLSLAQRLKASGEKEGVVRASPILESERGHVKWFVPLKVSTLLKRQQGRKKRPWFGILRTTPMGWFLGHPTPACFSGGGLYLSRVLYISVQWQWVIRSQERHQRHAVSTLVNCKMEAVGRPINCLSIHTPGWQHIYVKRRLVTI